jgi:hypothetical protein
VDVESRHNQELNRHAGLFNRALAITKFVEATKRLRGSLRLNEKFPAHRLLASAGLFAIASTMGMKAPIRYCCAPGQMSRLALGQIVRCV